MPRSSPWGIPAGFSILQCFWGFFFLSQNPAGMRPSRTWSVRLCSDVYCKTLGFTFFHPFIHLFIHPSIFVEFWGPSVIARFSGWILSMKMGLFDSVLRVYILLTFCSHLTFQLSNSPMTRLNYTFFNHTVYWIELECVLLFWKALDYSFLPHQGLKAEHVQSSPDIQDKKTLPLLWFN